MTCEVFYCRACGDAGVPACAACGNHLPTTDHPVAYCSPRCEQRLAERAAAFRAAQGHGDPR